MPKPDDLTRLLFKQKYLQLLPESANLCCHILMTYYYIKSKIYVTRNFVLKKPLRCYQRKSVKHFYGRDQSHLMFLTEVNPELNLIFHFVKKKSEKDIKIGKEKVKTVSIFLRY